MSKVVKGVGRAIGKVFNGAVKIIKGIGKGISKFAKSKLGKVIIGAALVYFGGSALMGGIGGASASSGGLLSSLSGAATGAAEGLSGAWSALTSGSMSNMASAFTGSMEAGASAVKALAPAAKEITAATANGAGMIGSIPTPPPVDPTEVVGDFGQATQTASPVLTADQTVAALDKASNLALNQLPQTTSSSLGNLWEGLGPQGKGYAVLGGAQLAGGLLSGMGQQAMYDAEVDRRNKIAQNRGTVLFKSGVA